MYGIILSLSVETEQYFLLDKPDTNTLSQEKNLYSPRNQCFTRNGHVYTNTCTIMTWKIGSCPYFLQN